MKTRTENLQSKYIQIFVIISKICNVEIFALKTVVNKILNLTEAHDETAAADPRGERWE